MEFGRVRGCGRQGRWGEVGGTRSNPSRRQEEFVRGESGGTTKQGRRGDGEGDGRGRVSVGIGEEKQSLQIEGNSGVGQEGETGSQTEGEEGELELERK